MNHIILAGTLQDTKYSHETNGVKYNLSRLIVKGRNGKEDNITLKYKSLSNPYKDGQEVSLVGNLRSYNGEDGQEVYVFTYFDTPADQENPPHNKFEVSGTLCKKGTVIETKSGKTCQGFVLKNIIPQHDGKDIVSYLPCYVWGKTIALLDNYNVGDRVSVKGEVHSRDSFRGDQIHVYHNLIVSSLDPISEESNG